MNAKEDLYKFIGGMRKQYASLCYLRDIKSCCASNNIQLVTRKFDTSGFCGAACVGKKHDTIILNERRNDKERMFDFVHELIHTRKHRNNEHQEFACFDKSQDSFIEWEANEGAAEFLVSYKIFIPQFCELYDMYTSKPVEWDLEYGSMSLVQALADSFSATEMIIKNRIRNLSYEIDQYRNGVKTDSILLLSAKQQEQRGIEPTNYYDKVERIQIRHSFLNSPLASRIMCSDASIQQTY